MVKVPFRRSRVALSVMDYGAVGDGETDDTEAIQACLNEAAIQVLDVYLPTGTYLVSPCFNTEDPPVEQSYSLELKNYVRIYGDGIGSTIITMANQASAKFILWGSGVDYARISKMTLNTPAAADMTTVYPWYTAGIGLVGSDYCTIDNVRCEHMRQGIKVGSGATCHSLTVSGFVTHDCITAFYAANLDGATLTDCDLQVVDNDTFQNHCLYLEREVHNVTISTSTLSGAGGYVVHCYLEGEYTSSYINFNGCDINATEYAMVIGEGWSHVHMYNNCNIVGGRSGGLWVCYGGTDILIEDFTAEAPYYMVACEDAPETVGWEFKNGTFDGEAFLTEANEDIVLTNVVLV